MNDALLNILVITVTLILIAGIFIVVNRRKQAQELQIKQLADEHGWQVFFIRESLRSGFVITNSTWRFESTATSSGRESGPGSTDISLCTTWTTSLPGSPVYIGSKTKGANLSGMIGRGAQTLLQYMTGSTMQNLSALQVGNRQLCERYTIFAQDETAARQLLSTEVESRLLAWTGMPLLIRQDANGLAVEINGFQGKKPDEILPIIQLGQALSARRQTENAIIEIEP